MIGLTTYRTGFRCRPAIGSQGPAQPMTGTAGSDAESRSLLEALDRQAI